MAASRRGGPVRWYSPDPRAVIPLDERFRVPHGLRRVLKRSPFRVTFDTAFEQVIKACARPRTYQRETWLSPQLIRLYTQVHRRGAAHSVEAWLDESPEPTRPLRSGPISATVDIRHPEHGRLVGGLYGVSLGGAFFGESMFSLVADASKVCLVHLVERLRARGYALLDAQLHNEHLEQFGLVTLPRDRYLEQLSAALAVETTFV